MRTREEIQKDIDALFVGGYIDRIMTAEEHRHRIIMLGKYREELDELDAFEKQEKMYIAKNKKINHQ